MAYDRVISELNSARLRGTSFPIVHSLIEASLVVNPDVSDILPRKRVPANLRLSPGLYK